MRDAIKLRYSLAHYLYTAFYTASTLGSPVIRPMWHEFPKDTQTFEMDDQFMFGESIMVAPDLTNAADPDSLSDFLLAKAQ